VRFLLKQHAVFCLEDWDHASPRLFDAFDLSEPLRLAFLARVGRPARRREGSVVFLNDHRAA
jgi:hypothetical protein